MKKEDVNRLTICMKTISDPIDTYARAIRRVRDYFDRCPNKLTPEQLKVYFTDLVESHSWSTVKIDRHFPDN
jgi:hypothetical protein